MAWPPSFRMATSNDTLVLVEGFSKRSASTASSFMEVVDLPATMSSAILNMSIICSLEMSSTPRRCMRSLSKYHAEALLGALPFLLYGFDDLPLGLRVQPRYGFDVLFQLPLGGHLEILGRVEEQIALVPIEAHHRSVLQLVVLPCKYEVRLLVIPKLPDGLVDLPALLLRLPRDIGMLAQVLLVVPLRRQLGYEADIEVWVVREELPKRLRVTSVENIDSFRYKPHPSTRIAFMAPSCPGRFSTLALPSSVFITVPFVIMTSLAKFLLSLDSTTPVIFAFL